jgi:hypothetical protein
MAKGESKRDLIPGWALACVFGLPLAALAQGNLSISDTLMQYQLYGKNWVRIEGDAVTSEGGGIGSDQHVNIVNNNVRINGNLNSGNRISAMRNVDVTGNLNARGNVDLTDDNNSVLGSVNIGGDLEILGGNPMGNSFGSPIKIKNGPVNIPAWAVNNWAGVAIAGTVHGGNRPPNFTFGSNDPFPAAWTRFPDTTVNFDGTKDCTILAGETFNMSMCGLGGSSSDSVLPPGRYGFFDMRAGTTLYLTSGTYHFEAFEMRSDGSKLLFIQPGNALTKMLIQNFLTVNDGIQIIAPVGYTDPAFKGGTVYIYVEGIVRLKDDNRIWATIVGKNHIHVESGMRLFGQILADCLTIENGFNGGVGFGKFIPLNAGARGPLKYSVMHFKHKD